MAKKTTKQLKAEAKEISRLRWEYARRNPYLIAEYDYLVLLAKQVLNVPIDQMHKDVTGGILINQIQEYINRWQYSPAYDPFESNPGPYHEDPPKKLLSELVSRMRSGFIPGLKGNDIKATKCITALPGLILDTGKPKKHMSEREIAKDFELLHSGGGEIVKVIGDMPDKILIEVDLINPKSTINVEFNKIIDKCFKILKFQDRLPKNKPRVVELSRDIQIHDYYVKHKSLRKTAQEFFKNQDLENAKRKVQKALKRASLLMSDGYKNLS